MLLQIHILFFMDNELKIDFFLRLLPRAQEFVLLLRVFLLIFKVLHNWSVQNHFNMVYYSLHNIFVHLRVSYNLKKWHKCVEKLKDVRSYLVELNIAYTLGSIFLKTAFFYSGFGEGLSINQDKFWIKFFRFLQIFKLFKRFEIIQSY